MQNENEAPQVPEQNLPAQPPVSASPQPTPIATSPTPAVQTVPATNNYQKHYEYAMLAFGGFTIASFFFLNGYMLKVSVSIFLLIATISIINGLFKPSEISPGGSPLPPADPNAPRPAPTPNPPSTQRKLIKALGIGILVIMALPVIGYMAMMAFIMVLLIFGGGRMGT